MVLSVGMLITTCTRWLKEAVRFVFRLGFYDLESYAIEKLALLHLTVRSRSLRQQSDDTTHKTKNIRVAQVPTSRDRRACTQHSVCSRSLDSVQVKPESFLLLQLAIGFRGGCTFLPPGIAFFGYAFFQTHRTRET